MTLELDKTDRHILQILQTHGKASIQEIADKVALSTSPCWRRIKRMEDAGLITGYTARLNPKLLGLHALAYVFVSLMDHREETIAAFARLVDSQERIIECASVTGESDYILKIAARDPEDLDHFLMRGILSAGLVRASHTHFVLRRTKPTSPWPLL